MFPVCIVRALRATRALNPESSVDKHFFVLLVGYLMYLLVAVNAAFGLAFGTSLQTVAVSGCFCSGGAHASVLGGPLVSTPHCKEDPTCGKRMMKTFIRGCFKGKGMFSMQISCEGISSFCIIC